MARYANVTHSYVCGYYWEKFPNPLSRLDMLNISVCAYYLNL